MTLTMSACCLTVWAKSLMRRAISRISESAGAGGSRASAAPQVPLLHLARTPEVYMNRRLIAIAAGALVLIAIVWLAYAWFAARSRYDYSGTIETREIEIASKIGGRVTEVSADEGQSVKAGQSLVRFECNELKAERMQ